MQDLRRPVTIASARRDIGGQQWEGCFSFHCAEALHPHLVSTAPRPCIFPAKAQRARCPGTGHDSAPCSHHLSPQEHLLWQQGGSGLLSGNQPMGLCVHH